MPFEVNEIFYSLQGEGVNAGKPAIFIRFSGCNLRCAFCDTKYQKNDFQKITTEDILRAVIMVAGKPKNIPMIVLTGGEPALQISGALISGLRMLKPELITIETNGTIALPSGMVDWTTVSPKAGTDLMVTKGDELKVLYPIPDLNPEDYEDYDFNHFLISPLDESPLPKDRAAFRETINWDAAVDYVKEHPKWRLSLQLHKVLKIR